MKNRFLLTLLCLSLFSGCKSDPEYLYVSDPLPIQQTDARVYPMDLLKLDTVDVVMIIDNSGSMGTIQSNIIANASLFFKEFAKQDYLEWKLGLLSTDQFDDPYLGFETPFSSDLIKDYDPSSFDQAVRQFQGAVESLGTSGAIDEYTFYNIERNLNDYSGSRGRTPFVRSTSHLFFIMVTDEPEQSQKGFGANYEAISFLNRMRGFAGSNKRVRFYGAFDHQVFTKCRGSSWRSEEWQDNPFDRLIKASEGFAISACIDDFGSQLSRIAEDIVSLVSLPSLLLRRRPKSATIEVFYEEAVVGQSGITYKEAVKLRSGLRDEGGQWFYDASTNTINFYSVDFVKDIENDRFIIDFDVDDGINRDE